MPLLRLARRASLSEWMRVVGMTIFFGSIIAGVPLFGIGRHKPHPEYPQAEPQLVVVPTWLGVIGLIGIAIFFSSFIVQSVRER
jgi:hypothetical protein